jgi:hypothetical protein
MAVKTFSLDITYSAADLWAVWTNAAGEYWNALTAAMEAYDSANWLTTKYLVAVSANGKSGEFKTTVPATLPGSEGTPLPYKLAIYFLPAAPTPSTANDYSVLEIEYVWNGTGEVTVADGGGGLTAGESTKLDTIHDAVQSGSA